MDFLARHPVAAYGIGAAVLLLVVWPLFQKVVHNFFYEETTGVPDIERAAKERQAPKIKGTAIVAGGSYTGLVTARILSAHFERVLVIESETLATPDQERKNVAQYNQVHTILMYTYWALKSLFPTIDEAMLDANGRISRTLNNYTSKGERIKVDPDLIVSPWLCMSRPGFEPMMRKLVMKTCPNIEFVNGTVTGLKVSSDKKIVTGVTYRPKANEGASGQELALDAVFVSDCTGPSCAGVKWLKAHDYPIPNKVQYSPAVHYSTITFPTTAELRNDVVWPDDTRWHDPEVLIYANAADPSSGRDYGVYLQRTEKKRLMLALMGWGPGVIPDSKSSVEDIIDFAAQDPKLKFFAEVGRKHLAEAIKQGETPQPHRLIVQSCWQYDYASVSGLPSNYVCLGDSRERYGQGITKATVGAITLGALLNKKTQNGRVPSDFARTFFKLEGKRTNHFYESTRIEDYAFKTTTPQPGESLDYGSATRKYVHWLIKAAHKDASVGSVFWESTNATRPPTDVFAPRMLWAVLKAFVLG